MIILINIWLEEVIITASRREGPLRKLNNSYMHLGSVQRAIIT
jgi:hypothetical protein